MDANKMNRDKAKRELHKNAQSDFEQILEAALHEIRVVRPFTSYLKNHPLRMNKTCWTLLQKQGQTHK